MKKKKRTYFLLACFLFETFPATDFIYYHKMISVTRSYSVDIIVNTLSGWRKAESLRVFYSRPKEVCNRERKT